MYLIWVCSFIYTIDYVYTSVRHSFCRYKYGVIVSYHHHHHHHHQCIAAVHICHYAVTHVANMYYVHKVKKRDVRRNQQLHVEKSIYAYVYAMFTAQIESEWIIEIYRWFVCIVEVTFIMRKLTMFTYETTEFMTKFFDRKKNQFTFSRCIKIGLILQ